MMKLFLIAAVLEVATAAKLTNIYLPPASAITAGGSSNFLNTPFQGIKGFQSLIRNQPSSLYGTPELTYQKYQRPIQITRYNNDNNGDGTYQFVYETENKISQQEIGELKNAGTNQESSVVHGSYSYVAPNGKILTVDYIADENGFRPSGAHLPTPPPIPEAILRSIQQNAIAGPGSSYDDGQYRQYDGVKIYNQNSGYRY
ncbi:cuticle protein [Holotrichia oblita]|uniref:Cuticle protein n=1 Tax=Holotrichia oblita TaxID=644536 RepID=A0ACB9SXD7_HOLOL|nr:cuticle protein [Holotrichia oblita]